MSQGLRGNERITLMDFVGLSLLRGIRFCQRGVTSEFQYLHVIRDDPGILISTVAALHTFELCNIALIPRAAFRPKNFNP